MDSEAGIENNEVLLFGEGKAQEKDSRRYVVDVTEAKVRNGFGELICDDLECGVLAS
jgi:hypothetical protein